MLSTLIGSIIVRGALKGLDINPSDLGIPDWLADILI
jgi:hypothetical protein